MAAGDLTTLAAVKAMLNVAGYGDDALLSRLITTASAGIKNVLNRDILLATYTDRRDGPGGPRMMAANYPLRSITSLVVNGVTIQPSSDGFVQPGYVFDERRVTLIGSVFTMGQSNVVMSYTAGYDRPPADLDQACVDWVAFVYRRRDRIGQSSKSVQGETVSFITSQMPPEVRDALKPWMKVMPT